MVKKNRVLIFIAGLICGAILFSSFSRTAFCKASLPSSVSFSGENNVMYLFDSDEARIYRYNMQGRLTRIYAIDELGKDLKSK